MRALITAESDVSTSMLRVASSALYLLGKQLPNLDGLEISTQQLQSAQDFPTPPHRPNCADDDFILNLRPWQNKSLRLFVASRQLGLDTFGNALFAGGVAIVSADRSPLALGASIIHETCHALGIVDTNHPRATAGYHCGNLCVMQACDEASQGLSLDWAAGHFGRNGTAAGLCISCRTDLGELRMSKWHE